MDISFKKRGDLKLRFRGRSRQRKSSWLERIRKFKKLLKLK